MSDTNDTNNGADSINSAGAESAPVANNEGVTNTGTSPTTETAPEAPAEATPPKAQSVPTVTPPENVTITLTGQLTQTLNAPAGTPLNEVFKSHNITGYSRMAFRDEKGQPVGLTRKITQNITLSSVNHTSGG